MITTIYLMILSYFLLGAVGFYFINKKKQKIESSKSWIKFITYFFIINLVLFSIVIKPVAFSYLTILIAIVGVYEMFNLYKKSNYKVTSVFLSGLLFMVVFAIGLIAFGRLPENIILFTFLTVSIFDSFSQICGQLFGRKKLFPVISPNKTLGGLIGGAVIAIIGALLLRELFPYSEIELVTNVLGIILFAFLGDLLTSLYKRKFRVKDYSRLIPGHGGILDRFDSLIAAGTWVAFYQSVNF
jgi:phosphatidate cytidylyltransferase